MKRYLILVFALCLLVGCGGELTPVPVPSDTWTRPADDMEMVYVPAGEFLMGSSDEDIDAAMAHCSDCKRDWFTHEQPQHTVHLDAFWIDKTEVTNAQYRRCVKAGNCDETWCWDLADMSGPEQPVACVNWEQARAYCEWAGGRLPTEAEWEYAACGPEGHLFPWGDEFDGTRLNYCDANCSFDWADWADDTFDDGFTYTAPVGSYPEGASWCGALDLAGNVHEWVADWYADYASGRMVNPTGPSTGEARVWRGGSWNWTLSNARCSARAQGPPEVGIDIVGIRCARDSQ